jgi:hypothetical protein
MKTTTHAATNHAPNDSKEIAMKEPTKSTTTETNSEATARSSKRPSDLPQLVASVATFLDHVEASLGPQPPQLTGAQKRRAAKPRKGAEKMLVSLAPIVQQHGLDSASLNAEEMLERLSDAEALAPLQARLLKILKRVEDELFTAQGDAWEMGLQLYTLLKRRSRTDGQVAANIEPIRSLFAYRHRSAKKDRLTKVQTRMKVRLKNALSLATKYDVATEAESGTEAHET